VRGISTHQADLGRGATTGDAHCNAGLRYNAIVVVEPVEDGLGDELAIGGRLEMRNGGVLFFARDVRHFFPQAYVTCLLGKGRDKVHILDRKDFAGGVVADIEDSLRFIERNTRLAYKIEKLQREEIPEYPMAALREAITNAVLRPLLEAGWLEMTIPDKPRSSRQRYRTTAAGVKALEEASR